MLRTCRIALAALTFCTAAAWTAPAPACPMCKVALEDTEDPVMMARPRAYMYSILFMLSMPATLLTGFGLAFYRLSQRQAAAQRSLLGPTGDGLPTLD